MSVFFNVRFRDKKITFQFLQFSDVFLLKGMGVSPGMHFHLAATINALTDIPLVPAMNSPGNAGMVHKFSLHWLNNKEIYFSLEAEKILQDLAKVALKREDSGLEKELLSDHKEPKTGQQQRVTELSPTRPVVVAQREGHGEVATQMVAGGLSHTPSVTSFNTDISQPSTASAQQLTLSEALDRRIEVLLQDWHQSSDLLFSVNIIP